MPKSETLEDVVAQIGYAVLEYINGARNDLSDKDISADYEAICSDFEKTKAFFNVNITDVCARLPKAQKRQQHLEYLASSYLFFRQKLDKSALLDFQEQKDFEVLFVYFLSSLFNLFLATTPISINKINDELALTLRNNQTTLLDEGVSVKTVDDEEVISKSKESFTLASFRYQKGTLMHFASFSLFTGKGIGNLGNHVLRFIFSSLEIPELKTFEMSEGNALEMLQSNAFKIRVIQLIDLHCADRYGFDRNALRESAEEQFKLIQENKQLKAQNSQLKQQIRQLALKEGGRTSSFSSTFFGGRVFGMPSVSFASSHFFQHAPTLSLPCEEKEEVLDPLMNGLFEYS